MIDLALREKREAYREQASDVPVMTMRIQVTRPKPL